MKGRFIPLIFFITCMGTNLRAENPEPEEPDLVLPPMILEVEDPALEVVEAVIPESGDIDLSPVSAELPEPEEIVLSTDAFDLAVPGGAGSAVTVGSGDFFSESTLGLGTQNHFIGDISLFMLGGEPRAQLRFHHEGRDGFREHASGSGYNFRKESLEGDLSFSPGNLEMDAVGSLVEEETGLQGRVDDFSSVLYRNLSADIDAETPIGERLSLGASARLAIADIVLAAGRAEEGVAVPEQDTEIDTLGEFSANLDTEYLKFGVDGAYRFLDWIGAGSPLHVLSAGIRAESAFPFALDVEADAGLRWIPGSEPVYPFSVNTRAYLGGMVTVFLSGGYRWELLSFGELRDRFPLVDSRNSAGEGILPREEAGWFVDAEIRYEPSDDFSLEAAGSWLQADSRFQPLELTRRGLFGQSWPGGTVFRASSSLGWQIIDSVSLDLGVGGILSGSDTSRPSFELSGRVEFAPRTAAYGISAGADYYSVYDENLVPNPVLPQVFVSGFYKVSEGVSLTLDIEDIVSAFSEEPGYTWGGYERPGFALVFKTNLSL